MNHREEQDTKLAFLTPPSHTLYSKRSCDEDASQGHQSRTSKDSKKKESWVSAKRISHHFPLAYNLVVLVELRSRHRGKAIAIHHVRLCCLDVIANP